VSKIKDIFNVLNGKVPVIMYGTLLLLIFSSVTISVFIYDIPALQILGWIGIVCISLLILVVVSVICGVIITCIQTECEAWPNTRNRIKAILKGENECSH